ncbi:MAG: polysaccharide biosynthesis protein [Gemella sp.]|nr:polysaccharide biosynthesis protein [Gemella sp.]
MKKDSLFKGTFILSISLILTKIIGLVYIIPYYAIIGGKNNMILINYAYNYYVLLLEISSAGLPLALSKLISKYNEEGNFEKSKKIYTIGTVFLLIMGLIGFMFFLFGSDFLARQTIASIDQPLRYTVEELSLVIKTLSLAVPFVILCAGLRGVFQAHDVMTPSAISQFLEQIVRISIMMVGSYIVLQITQGNIVYANAIATGAASVGAILAFAILIYYYYKYRTSLEMNQKNTSYFKVDSTLSILKELLLVAAPFVVVSTFFSIITIIDQNTIIPAMDKLGLATVAEEQFNIYNNYVNKLVMIAVALAPAFTGAFLPSITRLYVRQDKINLKLQINKLLLSLQMIVLPALFAMYILVIPLYTVFYEYDLDGFYLMKVYLPLALGYATYGITSIVMQAIDKQKFNILIVVFGIMFKYIFNEYFILAFESAGAIYCSTIAYAIMIFLNMYIINKNVDLNLKELNYNLLKLIFANFAMLIVVSAIVDSIFNNFNLSNKFDSVILIAISGIIGAPLYFFVLNKIKFTKYLFGREFSILSMIRRR